MNTLTTNSSNNSYIIYDQDIPLTFTYGNTNNTIQYLDY